MMHHKNLKVGVAALLALGLAACHNEETGSAVDASDAGQLAAFESLKAHKPNDGSQTMRLGSEDALEVQEEADAVTEGWKLSLSTDKSTFLLGEPVVLRVTLENISGEPRTVAPLLQPEYQQLDYRIVLPDGTERVFKPISLFCTLPILHERTIAPGARVSEEVKVFAARGGWLFQQTGDYLIRADFRGQTVDSGLMLSNSLRVTVRPGTPAEAEAGRLLTKGEAALLMQWESGDHLGTGLETLRQVTQLAPGSIHALYAHYVLGTSLARDFQGPEVRLARPDLALPHLEQVRRALAEPAAQGLNAALRTNTYTLLANSYDALGRAGEARAVRAELVQRYAGDPNMADAVARMRDLL